MKDWKILEGIKRLPLKLAFKKDGLGLLESIEHSQNDLSEVGHSSTSQSQVHEADNAPGAPPPMLAPQVAPATENKAHTLTETSSGLTIGHSDAAQAAHVEDEAPPPVLTPQVSPSNAKKGPKLTERNNGPSRVTENRALVTSKRNKVIPQVIPQVLPESETGVDTNKDEGESCQKIDKFPCSICDETFSTGQKRRHHEQMKHADAPRCLHCERSFKTENGLQAHVHHYLDSVDTDMFCEKDEPVDDKYNCAICEELYDGSIYVSCDNCNLWMHYQCGGIKKPPAEGELFTCNTCNGIHRTTGYETDLGETGAVAVRKESKKSFVMSTAIRQKCDLCKGHYFLRYMVGCHSCSNTFHLACVDPTARRKSKKWSCNNCTKKSYVHEISKGNENIIASTIKKNSSTTDGKQVARGATDKEKTTVNKSGGVKRKAEDPEIKTSKKQRIIDNIKNGKPWVMYYYGCSVCSKVFHHRDNREEHMKCHSKDDPGNNLGDPDGVRTYVPSTTCLICNQKFDNLEESIIHFPSHAEENRKICPFQSCTYSTTAARMGDLIDHIGKAHADQAINVTVPKMRTTPQESSMPANA